MTIMLCCVPLNDHQGFSGLPNKYNMYKVLGYASESICLDTASYHSNIITLPPNMGMGCKKNPFRLVCFTTTCTRLSKKPLFQNQLEPSLPCTGNSVLRIERIDLNH